MRTGALLLLLATAAVVLPRAADGLSLRAFTSTAFKVIGDLLGVGSTISELIDDKHEELLRHFDSISRDLTYLKHDMSSVMTSLRELESVGRQISWHFTVDTLEGLLTVINSNYDRFLLYQRTASSVENHTLLNFANKAVSHDSDSLHTTMYSLRNVVLGTQARSRRTAPLVTEGGRRTTIRNGRQRRSVIKEGLFRQFLSLVKASRGTVCGLGTSPQQLVFHLYRTLATVLARDYVMTQFGYMLLRLFDKGSFVVEAQHFTDTYKTTSAKLVEEASLALRTGLDSLFWRCDPAPHRRGVTFEEVTALLQGYLENEDHLKRKSHWILKDSCYSYCSDFDITSSKCLYSKYSSHELCQQRPCRGTLHDCRFVMAKATLCRADPKTGRRYNWIQDSDGRIYGRKDPALGSCHGTCRMWEWWEFFAICSTCYCLCDDDTYSARYFSLLPATADVAHNKIVTGVRFVKLDNVFYIQLEQAEAAPEGGVNSSTVQWQPIARRIDTDRDQEDRDYVRLSYYQRSVLMQELRGQEDQVLTGAAFHMVSGHLTVRAQVTSISETGALQTSSSRWLECGPAAGVPRLKLRSGPVPSTHSSAPSRLDSLPGQTVRFEASSLYKDAAQTTLPFLDTQPVAPRPAGWLSGLGLYHKGNTAGGYGGYLGLSVRGPIFG